MQVTYSAVATVFYLNKMIGLTMRSVM